MLNSPLSVVTMACYSYSFPVLLAFICETDEPRVLNGCVANEALLLQTHAEIEVHTPKGDFNGITQ